MVDSLSIDTVVTGRQERLISGDMDSEFHDVEYRISISGVWEQVGASSKSANALWLDALGGAEITFKSNTDDSTSYIIVPDLSHAARFSGVTRGVQLETADLRFISKSVYQEDDSISTGIAALRPHYQY